MDETIATWIIEFLLRQKVDDEIINGVISTIPLVNNNPRLKKTIHLRRIETEVSNGCVSEKLLESIEIIEALGHQGGESATEAIREAYCAVAVDCAARFLVDGGGEEEENGRFAVAVERVWRRRVCLAEGLASEAVARWGGELEKAVVDGEVRERVLSRNTRNEALRAVKRWLKVAWDALGPPFLEVVAAKAGGEVEALRRTGGGEGVACQANACREMVVFEAGKQKRQAPVRRKHVAVRSKCPRGIKITDNNEEIRNKATENTTGTEMQDGTAKVDGVKEAIGATSVESPCMGDHVPDDLQTVRPISSRQPVGNNVMIQDKQNGPQALDTPEVERVQRALKDSARELNAAVTDPPPEALRAAQTLLSKMAANNLKQAGQEEMQAPSELNSNGLGNIAVSPEQRKSGRKRSFMEPNGTCHTFEWDDDPIENPSGSPVRATLHSPRAGGTVPLKRMEDKKFQKRRERRRWTVVEEDTLRDGVNKFGKGNWKLIKLAYEEIFQNRSEVDLKDKWRNLDKFPS